MLFNQSIMTVMAKRTFVSVDGQTHCVRVHSEKKKRKEKKNSDSERISKDSTISVINVLYHTVNVLRTKLGFPIKTDKKKKKKEEKRGPFDVNENASAVKS